MLAFGIPGKTELIISGISALIFVVGLIACSIALKHGLKRSKNKSSQN